MAKPKTYQAMANELKQLMDWFEGDNLNLDEAMAKYQEAMELVAQMEAYLKAAENKVKKISLKFKSE